MLERKDRIKKDSSNSSKPPFQFRTVLFNFVRCGCHFKGAACMAWLAVANIRYGSRTESIVAYLSDRQYIPYNRLTELLSNVFGLNMSQGTVNNMLDKFAKKASGAIGTIKSNLSASEVVGSDETGIKINGKQAAFWTWQDKKHTLIVPAAGRGYETVE